MQNQLHPCTSGHALASDQSRACRCMRGRKRGPQLPRSYAHPLALCTEQRGVRDAGHLKPSGAKPGTARLTRRAPVCRQAVPQSLHPPHRSSTMTAAPLQKSGCYQNSWQGPRRRLNKRQQLAQHSNTLCRAPARPKSAHAPRWQQACSARCGWCGCRRRRHREARHAPVRPPGGTGRPAAACPSRR